MCDYKVCTSCEAITNADYNECEGCGRAFSHALYQPIEGSFRYCSLYPDDFSFIVNRLSNDKSLLQSIIEEYADNKELKKSLKRIKTSIRETIDLFLQPENQ